MSNANDKLKDIEDSYDKYISDLNAQQQNDSDYGSYEDYLNNSRSKSNNGVNSSDVLDESSSHSGGADSSESGASDNRNSAITDADIPETDRGVNNSTDSTESSTGHNSKLLSDGGNGPSEIGKGSLFQNAGGAVSGATGALKNAFGGLLGGGLSAIKGLFKSLGGKAKSTAGQLGVPVQAVVAVFSLVTGVSFASLLAIFGGSPDFHITSDPMDNCVMEQYKWKQNQEYKPVSNTDGSAKAIYEMLSSSSIKFTNESIAGILSNGVAESSLNPACFEMNYKAGTDSNADMTLARTHHRNWDTYCDRMFEIYAESNLSINEDAYKYNEIVGTYEQRIGKATGGTVVGTHYYPGIGLFQWTGPRAYHLQEFSDTLDNPIDNNLDGHNDAMYTMKCQLAFFIEENYWSSSLTTFSNYSTLTDWATNRKFTYSVKWYVNLPGTSRVESKVPINKNGVWYYPYCEVTSKDESGNSTKEIVVSGDTASNRDNVTSIGKPLTETGYQGTLSTSDDIAAGWDVTYRQKWKELQDAEDAAMDAWKEAYRLTYLDSARHPVYGNRYHNDTYWNSHMGYPCNNGNTSTPCSSNPCVMTTGHILTGTNKCDLNCTNPHHPSKTKYWDGLKSEYAFEEVKDDFVAEMNAHATAVANKEEWEREVATITEYNAKVANGAQNAKLCAYEFYKNWLGANIALSEHLANAEYYYSKMMEDSKPAEPYVGTPPTTPNASDSDDYTGATNTSSGWKPNNTAGTNLLALLNRELTNMQLHNMRVEASKNTCGVSQFDNSSIASAAVSWAWPQGHPEYCDVDDQVTLADGVHLWQSKCTSLYIAVKNIVAPSDTQYYSSCDRGAATAIRASGSDDDFPMGACIQQRDYMDQHSDKWENVGSLDSVGKDGLLPGDILVEDHHIVVFVGGEAAAEKWPDLFTADDAKYGIVHSSIGTTPDDSRGPRFDKDMDWMFGRSYTVYRCLNQDLESSHCKQEVDSQKDALGTLHDGSFVP